MYKVILEKQDTLTAVAFGYIQIKADDLFTPIAIAIDKEGHIHIYNDYQPDGQIGDILNYKIKRTIFTSEIKYVLHERYAQNMEYEEYGRIVFIFKENSDKGFELFYKMEDKLQMNRFLRHLNNFVPKIKKKKTYKYPLVEKHF